MNSFSVVTVKKDRLLRQFLGYQKRQQETLESSRLVGVNVRIAIDISDVIKITELSRNVQRVLATPTFLTFERF